MAYTPNIRKYNLLARLLHWLMAIVIIGLVGVGVYMTGLEREDPSRPGIYELHKAVGVLVLLAAILRLAWTRLLTRPPALPEAISGPHRILSRIGTYLFYLLMIAIPLAGIAMSQFYGKPVNVFDMYQLPMWLKENHDWGKIALEAHEYLAWTLVLLVIIHVAATIKHRRNYKGLEGDVIKRML